MESESPAEHSTTHGRHGNEVLSRMAAAVPDVLFASAFVITWIAPETFGRQAVAYLMLVMVLEFLIVHVSGFFGVVVLHQPLSDRTRNTSLVALATFFAFLALAFSIAFQAWWPLWTILLLALNRLLIVLTGTLPEGRERAFIQRGWGISAILFLACALVTAFLPLPALGITNEVIQAQDLPGNGLWNDEPYRVLTFGALYFFAQGGSQLFSHRWLSDQPTA